MSPLKYFIAFMLGVLLLSACTTLEVGVEHTPRSPLSTATRRSVQIATATATDADAVATALARLTITPSPTPTPDPRAYVGLPDKGLLYLGNPQESLALFLREPAHSSADPNLGSIWYLDKSFRNSEASWYVASGNVPSEPAFDFRNFARPYPVTFLGKVGQVYDVKRGHVYDPDRGDHGAFIYVSFAPADSTCPTPAEGHAQATLCPGKQINQLLEIDSATVAARNIWTHDLASETYPEFHGVTLIDQVAGPIAEGGDRYLILRLLPCSACEVYPPYAMLLLNTRTGKELYLGRVGNVNVDFIERVVSYQNLAPLQVECMSTMSGGFSDPRCAATGHVTYSVPTGELLKQPLP